MDKLTNPEILNQRVVDMVVMALGYVITKPNQFQKAKDHISQLSEHDLFSLYLKWNGVTSISATTVAETLDNIRAATVKKPPQRVLVRIFVDRFAWAVRVVETGESYGLRNRLTYKNDEPAVEFYDTRHPHTNLGQFVSRYRLSTLTRTHPYGHGLCLDDGVPDWTISDDCFCKIQDWLNNLDLLPAKEETSVSGDQIKENSHV